MGSGFRKSLQQTTGQVDHQSLGGRSARSVPQNEKVENQLLHNSQRELAKLPVKITTRCSFTVQLRSGIPSIVRRTQRGCLDMLLKEIGIEVTTPIEFCEDNEPTIKLGQNKMASARSKHIELRHHVIIHHNDKGTI